MVKMNGIKLKPKVLSAPQSVVPETEVEIQQPVTQSVDSTESQAPSKISTKIKLKPKVSA
jgi:hypothetical protein